MGGLLLVGVSTAASVYSAISADGCEAASVVERRREFSLASRWQRAVLLRGIVAENRRHSHPPVDASRDWSGDNPLRCSFRSDDYMGRDRRRSEVPYKQPRWRYGHSRSADAGATFRYGVAPGGTTTRLITRSAARPRDRATPRPLCGATTP